MAWCTAAVLLVAVATTLPPAARAWCVEGDPADAACFFTVTPQADDAHARGLVIGSKGGAAAPAGVLRLVSTGKAATPANTALQLAVVPAAGKAPGAAADGVRLHIDGGTGRVALGAAAGAAPPAAALDVRAPKGEGARLLLAGTGKAAAAGRAAGSAATLRLARGGAKAKAAALAALWDVSFRADGSLAFGALFGAAAGDANADAALAAPRLVLAGGPPVETFRGRIFHTHWGAPSGGGRHRPAQGPSAPSDQVSTPL